MPSCVFRRCRNYTVTVRENKKVSFHTFPKDSCMKEKWIKIIRTQRREIDWMPAKNSTICSEHFNEGDIYETKKKLRRLKKTAVPIIEEIKYEEDESSDVIEQNEQCSLQKKTNKKLQ
ncbi:THAP domain-containing protein 2-like isoform X2 [Colias croceus]|uniref:THAP domain-containing protein 2-like isoform X2 n=1 Tax=Colias crocea TaxID=72248 RepID=UPI001E2811BC|nr:THAP domain-containing protein 2-like isoform X2 [Colias croceus]